MNTQDDARLIAEAQAEFARYLSDEIAPMIFAGSAEILFNAPPEIMARGIHSWVGLQLQGPRPSPVVDYLLHSARKVHNLGELELVPKDHLKAFLDKLAPLLVTICPEAHREELATNLSLLDVSDGGGMAARISVGPGPSRGDAGRRTDNAGHDAVQGEERPPSQQLEKPPVAPPRAQTAPSDTAPADEQTGAHIDRLNMLLDRWERMSSATSSTPTDSLNASLAGAESAVMSRIIDEIATSARSTTDLDSQLRYLNEVGVGHAGTGVFRLLSEALPDWAPTHAPPTEGDEAFPLSGAAETMKKVVDLAKDPAELNERFRQLISTALDEFNSGALGRAVTVLDLAQRMISKKEVDPSIAANIIDQTAGKLEEPQLRKYVDREDKKLLLRRVLNFFPTLQVDNLIQDLLIEERRDRRRLILRMLTIHGEESRETTIKILDDSLSGDVPQPWYVQRNLIYLLRSVPATEEDEIEKEIDVLVRASVPGGELPMVREALSALGQIDHPRAVKTLVARVSELEDLALQNGKTAHGADEVQSLLDTAIKALIHFDAKEARRCVVTHGLNRRPGLGDTMARLAMLAGQDLTGDSETVARIVEAIDGELPVKVFGVSVKTSRRTRNLEHLFESLSGTDTPKIREVYDRIVRDYPGEEFANTAAYCLTKLGTGVSLDSATDPQDTITSLSGDLSLFGLPNLMQNLADSRVEGILTVLDGAGNSTASITLRDGRLLDARTGRLTGEIAIYQLLERPVLGRFIFVNQPLEATRSEGDVDGIAVIALLMEGMRRYDEFNRAAAIIPDEGRFAATGKQPSGLPDEDDADFVNGVWVQAIEGKAPIEIEKGAVVDGYRIFRLFEHWVNEGALEPKS